MQNFAMTINSLFPQKVFRLKSRFQKPFWLLEVMAGWGGEDILTQQFKVCLKALNYDLAGILVIGGYPSGSATQSIEFWSAADPEQRSCVLNDYPREMGEPTANLVSGRLVACWYDTCEIYEEGSWQHLQNTTTVRTFHSSATTKDAVLLIGGRDSQANLIYTTEWIPVDGSAAHQGPFNIRHGDEHCTIQISAKVIVVTGGMDTEDYATQYNLADGNETPLTSLGRPRDGHACSIYQDTDGQQVSKRLCSCKCSMALQLSTMYPFTYPLTTKPYKTMFHLLNSVSHSLNTFCTLG